MELKINLMVLFSIFTFISAQANDLMINIDHRASMSLNGKWNIIIDPYEIGYYDYRFQPSPDGFFKNQLPKDKSDRIEYSFDTDLMLQVPGDWNSQNNMLFFYEGTVSVWYKKSFDYQKKAESRLFLYFGAVNYQAKVYLNGQFIGEHEGGFTPFQFEVTHLVREKDNFVIVKVDNKRFREAVPTLNTDWFNYGGITRQVMLVEVPGTFIKDYFIQLEKGSLETIKGWIQLDGEQKQQNILLSIPEAKVSKSLTSDEKGFVAFSFNKQLDPWSPENPKLYDVVITSEADTIMDRIGFRSIETQGTDILLNGNPIYLRGICIHEEAPFLGGASAYAKEHAQVLLGWAKELHCNFVRLAHYPHNELMIRTADEMGLLVWAEIPVYWTILWENEATFNNARQQLTEMITRDKNRASVILWSMANETPLEESRLEFLKQLAEHARQLDLTRLIAAAMERHYIDDRTQMIDDPFGEFVDVLGCNEYIGWYDGLPPKCDNMEWKTSYNKPVIISEFGGDALYGYHGDELTRWTEEFQRSVYEHSLEMLKKVRFVKGMSPWILKDFRSPRRLLPRIQDYWNFKRTLTSIFHHSSFPLFLFFHSKVWKKS